MILCTHLVTIGPSAMVGGPLGGDDEEEGGTAPVLDGGIG